MATNRKYGRVDIERGNIGADEPVVIFRYRDKHLPDVLARYIQLCEVESHQEDLRELLTEVKAWQGEHRDMVRTPGSTA